MRALSILVELARILAGQPDLRALSTDYWACDAPPSASTIEAVFDDGRRLFCVSSSESAPFRCIEPTHPVDDDLGRSSCDPDFVKRLKPGPAWIVRLGRLARGTLQFYAPREPGVPTVIVRDDADRVFAALRTKSGWRMMYEPLGEGKFWDDLRVLDASALTGVPSFGLVVSIHDGGMDMGKARTELVVLADEDGRLKKKDTRLIGFFHWWLEEGDRQSCEACAHSYDARPHIEVRLEPTVTAERQLKLTTKVTALKRLRSACSAREIKRGRKHGGEDEESLCPIEELREVQRNAGLWRYEAGRLVR